MLRQTVTHSNTPDLLRRTDQLHINFTHTATHCNTLQHTATHCNTPDLLRRTNQLPSLHTLLTSTAKSAQIVLPWLIHMCVMTHFHFWHDSFIYVTCLIQRSHCWHQQQNLAQIMLGGVVGGQRVVVDIHVGIWALVSLVVKSQIYHITICICIYT